MLPGYTHLETDLASRAWFFWRKAVPPPLPLGGGGRCRIQQIPSDLDPSWAKEFVNPYQKVILLCSCMCQYFSSIPRLYKEEHSCVLYLVHWEYSTEIHVKLSTYTTHSVSYCKSHILGLKGHIPGWKGSCPCTKGSGTLYKTKVPSFNIRSKSKANNSLISVIMSSFFFKLYLQSLYLKKLLHNVYYLMVYVMLQMVS